MLSEKKSSLSESEKENIRDLSKKLEVRQNSNDDPSLLPCVTVKDVEKERFYTSGHKLEDDGKIKYFYHAGTTGLITQQKVFSVRSVDLDDLRYSKFFLRCCDKCRRRRERL